MATTTPSPDLFLARRASRGDARAWDEIVALYGEKIFNLCLRFASDAAEAEDLTQEVFVKLYRNLHQYRGDVPFVAWTLRLSRNLCIDHYRQQRLRRESETVSDEILRHMPSADDVVAASEDRERLRMVHETLAEMPEELAIVVLLRDLQGLSYDEVAEFLDLRLGTVKSRLNRARQDLVTRLRARLEADGAPVHEREASA